MSGPHPLLGCACPVCHTWRRVGLLLARGDTSVLFREWALRRVREFYTEALDAAEGFVLVTGPPVAVGGPAPSVPEGGGPPAPAATPVPPPEVGGGAVPATAAGGNPPNAPGIVTGPAAATSKAGPGVPSANLATSPPGVEEPSKAVKAESPPAEPREEGTKSPVSIKRSPAKHKRKKKKDKKDKEGKKSAPAAELKHEREESTPKSVPDFSRPSESPSAEVGGRPPRREEEEELRTPPASPKRRRASPVRGERERPRSRDRDRRRARSPRSERRERDSRSRDRRGRRSPQSREVPSRTGHLRPPEPEGPPPCPEGRPIAPPPGHFYHGGWWQPQQRFWGSGSKGVKRRARAEDIRAYGPDADRKYQREQRDRGR